MKCTLPVYSNRPRRVIRKRCKRCRCGGSEDSKITRPLLTGVFPRKRLFEAMDSSRKRPVTWIAGPPGCGKTILVCSYLDAWKLPCLWYQVDPGDTDPATFFYYLDLAAREAAPPQARWEMADI